jgi:cytochrome c oxidase subunit 2
MKTLVGFSLLAELGTAGPGTSIFDPASPSAESIRSLFFLVLAITGVIFLLVEGVLLYSIVRFRHRTPPGTEPAQVYGSMPIEIAWTAAPALIVFLLSLILTRAEFEVRVNPEKPPPGSKPLYVTVIGRQWWWEYVYDKYDGRELNFITANELHVPASEEEVPRPVYLTLKSADVCHSFWVPRLAGKTDLIPGRVNQMWFQASEPGLYLGQCAEYCGTQHAHMLLRVIVDSPAGFQTWLDNQRKPAVDSPTARAGRDVFLAQSCVNCHRIRGTNAKGTYAPDLTHLRSRLTLGSCMIENNEENLRHWIRNPQEIKEGCLMPAFGLSESQVKHLADYLWTLK